MDTTPRYVVNDMKKHILLAFSSIEKNMIDYWNTNDISEYIDIKEDEKYTVNDMEITFDYSIRGNKLIITSVNDETTGAYILYKSNEYVFELDNEYISKFEENIDIDSQDTPEVLIEFMSDKCISVKYMDEYHNYDSIKNQREKIFNIACALTVVGKYAFKEQINYFNGKNMIKYM